MSPREPRAPVTAVPSLPAPPRYKTAIVTWLALYPTLTLILMLCERLDVLPRPLWLRTLVLTVALVPFLVFVLVPWLNRRLDGWLHRR